MRHAAAISTSQSPDPNPWPEAKVDACRIALVGATGAVGGVFLKILEERRFPASEIRLCASKRSVGKKLKVMGRQIAVEEVTPRLLSEVDIVFISAGANVSLEVAPLAVKQGAFVVDKSSAFRMDPDAPYGLSSASRSNSEENAND